MEFDENIRETYIYASAPRGKRAIGTVPRNYGANLTLLASLSVQGTGEAMLLDGSADATAFETSIEQILAKSLRPGQIVILDHLSIHLGPRVKEAIEARGCPLWFLPAYSPDFSATLGAFSKLKAILRRVGARTREALTVRHHPGVASHHSSRCARLVSALWLSRSCDSLCYACAK